MKSKQWMIGAALAAMTFGSLGVSQAQPAPGANVADAGKGKGRGARARQTVLTPAMLAKVLGAPLTPQQKRDVAEAVKTYNESVAKAVGLTPEEMAVKLKAYRETQKNGKAPAPPAPPAG